MIPCQGGCGKLLKKAGVCSKCDNKRTTGRPYNARWAKESRLFLRANPICVCRGSAEGCRGIAQVTDHEPPHRGDLTMFWDQSTWRPMSKVCHDRKTALEDGGFGNMKKQHANVNVDRDAQSTVPAMEGEGGRDPHGME